VRKRKAVNLLNNKNNKTYLRKAVAFNRPRAPKEHNYHLHLFVKLADGHTHQHVYGVNGGPEGDVVQQVDFNTPLIIGAYCSVMFALCCVCFFVVSIVPVCVAHA
jgi:hypothetical protein